MPTPSYAFPPDFHWGTATSAYQIEGATTTDGRQPSVWDTFSQTPQRTVNGDTGAIACDHYHRYPDDIRLMADLGIRHYRFSVAWPRILPTGRGPINSAGLDFYQRLIDTLLAHDITPHVTLFHWDSPQALEEAYGSWRSRQMAYDFADYVTVVVKALGDRVTHWSTLNEIHCFTHLGYGLTQPPHAPGTLVEQEKAIWQTSHHAILAHGLATQAIRTATPQPCHISIADNPAILVPFTDTPDDIAATQRAFHDWLSNGGVIFPILTGAYSPLLWEKLGPNAPDIQPGDLEIIHQPIDSLGLNIYTAGVIRASDRPEGFEYLPFAHDYPRLHMPWLHLVPDSLYWGVRHISETLDRPDLPIYITENGCAAADTQIRSIPNSQKIEILDLDRILYLKQHLIGLHRAIAEGYPVQGYFLWSFLDNFEWAWGYERRFGITHVNYQTQERTPKASFHWYKECIHQNRIV